MMKDKEIKAMTSDSDEYQQPNIFKQNCKQLILPLFEDFLQQDLQIIPRNKRIKASKIWILIP